MKKKLYFSTTQQCDECVANKRPQREWVGNRSPFQLCAGLKIEHHKKWIWNYFKVSLNKQHAPYKAVFYLQSQLVWDYTSENCREARSVGTGGWHSELKHLYPTIVLLLLSLLITHSNNSKNNIIIVITSNWPKTQTIKGHDL